MAVRAMQASKLAHHAHAYVSPANPNPYTDSLAHSAQHEQIAQLIGLCQTRASVDPSPSDWRDARRKRLVISLNDPSVKGAERERIIDILNHEVAA